MKLFDPQNQMGQCHPRIAEFGGWAGERMSLMVSEGLRSLERQGELYRLGRDADQDLVDREQPGKVAPGERVTNAEPGQSPHNPGQDGKAYGADFVPMRNGRAQWNDNDLFDQLGDLVDRFNTEVPGLKLKWGGAFRIGGRPDKPHVELEDWATLRNDSAPDLIATDGSDSTGGFSVGAVAVVCAGLLVGAIAIGVLT